MERSSRIVKTTGGVTAVALSAVLAFGCLSFTSPEPAYAATAAEKQAEAEEALAQLNAMQETLDQASEAYIQALRDYEGAVTNRDAAKERIDELSGEIAEVQDRLGVRAREMYRSGNTTFLDLLLGSATFDELTTNWDLLTRVNESDANMARQIKELRTEAQIKEDEYAKQAEIAQDKSKEATEAFEQAEVLVEQMQATYESLSEEAMALYAQEQAASAAAVAAAYADVPTEGGYVNDDGTVTDIATGQTYSSSSEYVAATGNAIVDRARAMIGSSYVWGGVGGADGGFDCSGLVSYAITGQNVRLGTSYTFGDTYQEVSDPQPGDLYVTDGHVAIVSGNGYVIEAVDEAHGVMERQLTEKAGGKYVRVS